MPILRVPSSSPAECRFETALRIYDVRNISKIEEHGARKLWGEA